MRVPVGWGIIGVRTGIWIPYRSRVGASRLSQASGLLAPLAGSETTRPALGSGGAQPGACMVCPTCYRDPLPGRESQKDGLGTVKREIARKGSPQPEAVPRTRHTHPTNTLMGRTHRERPLTPVDSTQIGSWQMAVGSTQHAVPEGGDTAHAHARNDTPPRPPRPADGCTDPDTRRTHHPTGTPRPGQPSRSGSGSGSAPAPAPARRTDAPQPPPHFPLPLPPRPRRHASPVAPAPATHPDPRHTGLRRCQPEPRPTSRLGSSREPLANRSLAVADRLQPGRRPAPDPAATSANHSPLRRCRLQPGRRPARPQPATSANHSPLRRCRL